MTKTPADRLALAAAAFEAGFASEAARKRALEDLNRAYDAAREEVGKSVRAIAWAINPGATDEESYKLRGEVFARYELPFGLHQVRDRHFEAVAEFPAFLIVRDMIALRDAIKAAPVAPAKVKPEAEVKAEAVRRSIVDEMERRKTLFVEGLDLGRVFAELYPRTNKAGEIIPSASLPVTVNAHWVHGHKGAEFVRHFFYLNGKLTPLNTIMAIAQTLDAEAGA